MDSIEYYNKYASVYFENTVDLDMSEIIAPFIKLLPENAEVLDLGCGSGRDTLYMEEAGFYVTALDGSEEMCKLAEIYTDKEVLNITFDELDFDEVFDGIWACASLIHVEDEQIDQILEKVIDALNPGGVLYMSFYHGDYEGYRSGRYIHEYTKASLKELIARHPRVDIEDIWKTDDVRNEDKTWINIIVRKEKDEEEEDE